MELIFAADSLYLTPQPGSAGGYDLDGVCTCPGPPSCALSPKAKSKCDSDGGVDQAGTLLLQDFLSLSGLAAGATTNIAQGKNGLLIRISHYNGGQNDAEVIVAVFGSDGTEIDPDGGKETPPRHDGTDLWTVDRGSLKGADGPPFIPLVYDTKAYVTNGTIVARTDITISVSDLVLHLNGAVVSAKLVHKDSAYRLDEGRLAGRWPTKFLLPSLDTLKDPFVSNLGVCGQSALYQSLKDDICAAVDLVADPSLDNAASPAACDSVGMSLLFSAEQAQFGSIADTKPARHHCGDAWTDDCPH
jgi:hypothetical protein